jgi:hypothetical protein
MATRRRLTLTNLSITGIMITRPGPLGVFNALPNLKITPLSYSLRILMAALRKSMSNTKARI